MDVLPIPEREEETQQQLDEESDEEDLPYQDLVFHLLLLDGDRMQVKNSGGALTKIRTISVDLDESFRSLSPQGLMKLSEMIPESILDNITCVSIGSSEDVMIPMNPKALVDILQIVWVSKQVDYFVLAKIVFEKNPAHVEALTQFLSSATDALDEVAFFNSTLLT